MYDVDIVLEIGLMTANANTLKILRRAHIVTEFIDSVNRVHEHKLGVCAHVIADLPYDNIDDVIRTAELMNEI